MFSFANAVGTEGTVVVACVADGAGSASRSQLGASLTTKCISSWFAENFSAAIAEPAESVFTVLSKTRSVLQDEASRQGVALRELACTMLVVAVRDDGEWIAWQLGDGGIIGQLGEHAQVLCRPQKGEYANVTSFITEDDAFAQVDCSSSRMMSAEGPPMAFLLFTDGIERVMMDRRTLAVANAVPKMLRWHSMATEDQVQAAVEQNLRECFRETTFDDSTLIVLGRASTP